MEGSFREKKDKLFSSALVCVCAQSCLTLCNPMDGSPPGSSVHGISQARILEWVTISFSTGSSQLRDRTQVSYIGRRILLALSHPGSPIYVNTWIQIRENVLPITYRNSKKLVGLYSFTVTFDPVQ